MFDTRDYFYVKRLKKSLKHDIFIVLLRKKVILHKGMKFMSMLNREVLENLIQDGFDLKLIAFELKVPLEKLEEYKRELEKYNLLKRNTSKQIDYSVVS